MNVVPMSQSATAIAHLFSTTITDVDMSLVDMSPDSKLRRLIFACLLNEAEDPRIVAIQLFARDDPDFLNHSVPNWLTDERFWIAKEALRQHYHRKYGKDYFQPERDEIMHRLIMLTKLSTVSAKTKLKVLIAAWKMRNGSEI